MFGSYTGHQVAPALRLQKVHGKDSQGFLYARHKTMAPTVVRNTLSPQKPKKKQGFPRGFQSMVFPNKFKFMIAPSPNNFNA